MESGVERIHEARGVIEVVQEDRFRLRTEDGRSLLLFLGPRAGKSLRDIEQLANDQKTITVEYRGEPDAGAVATAIRVS